MTATMLPVQKQAPTSSNLDDLGYDAAVVTPSDTVNLPDGPCRMLYIGVTGDVTIITMNGNTVLFKAVPVGILRMRAACVLATGTTATNILAIN